MGRVIGVMERLRDAGNSLVVVEHDPQIMVAADHALDIGPGPGEHGGRVVFFGTPSELMANTRSLTGDYLAGRKRADRSAPIPVPINGAKIELIGASDHNLKNVDVAIPLERLVCITGVSGSGKSTLVQDVLHAALLRAKGKPTESPGAHRGLRGHDLIGDAVLIDQTPIGRTTRSNPASYIGAFDAIRRQFAGVPLAKERGYTAGTFSFNAGTGRCPTCGGNGFEHVEMQFLSDVYLRCPDCDGKRYRAEVLDVTLDGRTVADVLEMTVREARDFFDGASDIDAALQPLVVAGTVDDVIACRASHTGAALQAYAAALGAATRTRVTAVREPVPTPARPDAIRVHHAREHNLKDIDVAIPRDRFTVVTGVSGS